MERAGKESFFDEEPFPTNERGVEEGKALVKKNIINNPFALRYVEYHLHHIHPHIF